MHELLDPLSESFIISGYNFPNSRDTAIWSLLAVNKCRRTDERFVLLHAAFFHQHKPAIRKYLQQWQKEDAQPQKSEPTLSPSPSSDLDIFAKLQQSVLVPPVTCKLTIED